MKPNRTLDDFPELPSSEAPAPVAASRSPIEQAAQRPAGGEVDLRECKAEARRLLPPGHPVRQVLEAEPDTLTGPEAIPRMAMLLRLILAHRRRRVL